MNEPSLSCGAVRATAFLLACSLAHSAAAQTPCFEPEWAAGPQLVATPPVFADFNGDGRLDMAYVQSNSFSSNELRLALGVDGFTFGPSTLVVAPTSPIVVGSIAGADVNSDGDVDLVWTSRNTQGTSQSSFTVLGNDGNGNFTIAGSQLAGNDAVTLHPADFDGDGDVDFLVTHVSAGEPILVVKNFGFLGFSQAFTIVGGNVGPFWAEVGDVDGDGDVDVVSTNFTGTQAVLRNNGSGAFAVGSTQTPVGVPFALGDIDGDGDRDLVSTSGGVLGYRPNLGNGTFGTTIQIVGPTGDDGDLGDLDGDGDLDILLAGATLTPVLQQGGGVFTVAPALATSGPRSYPALADAEGDGDLDVLAASATVAGTPFLYRNCDEAGRPYCFGDGSGTACPCANPSPVGARAGCRNTLALDGTLRGEGRAQLSNDTFVLRGTGMPDSPALYFQGTSAVNGGAGVVFGAGLRCAGGSIVRLGVEINAAGASLHPGPGDAAISGWTGLAGIGDRVYQVWYRDQPTPCAPQAFSLTNGLRVTWRP